MNNALKTLFTPDVSPSQSPSNIKKLFFRKSLSDRSTQNKKSLKKMKYDTLEFKQTYLKTQITNLFNIENIKQGMDTILQKKNVINSIKTQINNYTQICCLKKDQQKIELQNRNRYLQQQLNNKNNFLKQHIQQYEKLLAKNQQILAKLDQLQQSNNNAQIWLQNLRIENRNLSINNKKLEVQKNSLNKKIVFLQNINLSTQTKNIQSARQLHLQKQLMDYKWIIQKGKSQLDKLIQNELNRTRQKLFNAEKVINALQISNKTYKLKIKELNNNMNNSEQHIILKNKYKKMMNELKEIKKQNTELKKQYNKRIRQEEQKSIDFSLSECQY